MTYSIVARDRNTGQLGVAVQSHWFTVGAIVPWAAPEIGAIATQANVEVAFGPHGLALLKQGLSAAGVLDRLLADDPGPHGRQLAVIDTHGRVAAHTGRLCMPEAGHVTGEGVSCQANIMATNRVWPAMLSAYERAEAPFPERLLAALDAAEEAGGDIRGRQSAALLVVPSHGEHWETTISLRVDDHPEPLDELRRLLHLQRAYALASEADALVNERRHREAAELYEKATEQAPENDELLFWAGLAAAERGDIETAVARVNNAIERQPGWAVLLRRLPPEVAPAAATVLEQL